MSSILKALRKVEDENATMGEGSVDLAHDILKRNYDEKKSAPWGLIVVLGLFVTAFSFAGWWFLSSPLETTENQLTSEAKQQIINSEIPVSKPSEVIIETPVSVPPANEPVSTPVQQQISTAPKIEIVEKNIAEKAVKSVDIPDLMVEEIVYHPDPAARLAVINDLPVMVGTDIEGVRVEEILPDRVRFSYQGFFFNKIKKN